MVFAARKAEGRQPGLAAALVKRRVWKNNEK